jgi:hypothetical protein
MNERSVCRRCGYMGLVDARYCARCGLALAPLSTRLTDRVDHVLKNISPLYIGFLGLVILILTSMFADRLIVTKLSFPFSLVLIALVFGCGNAYLGWQWEKPSSSRVLLMRILMVFAGMVIFLIVVWLIDITLLSFLTDRVPMVEYDIPGVYVEASTGFRRISIGPNVPPYWFVVMIYSVLAGVIGNLIQKATIRRTT